MTKPFTIDDAQMEEVRRSGGAFLKACRVAAEHQFRDRKPDPVGPLPTEASVVKRTIISLAVQMLKNGAEAEGADGFNFVDGIAHGLAAILAQVEQDAAEAAYAVIRDNTRGYWDRNMAMLQAAAGRMGEAKGRA